MKTILSRASRARSDGRAEPIAPKIAQTRTSIARHRTAIARGDLSRRVRLAIEDQLISTGTTVFDYGCGLGDDVRQLNGRGITSAGWDPVHHPRVERRKADVVNLGYVVN